ncbi:unnamed protein product [Ectocarpus fasciculatus]
MVTYSEAEPRFYRWLRKYRDDRAAHSRARKMHPDPAMLDADLARVVCRMGITGCYRKPAELSAATELLLHGARASTEYFQNNELFFNLGEVVDLLECLAGKDIRHANRAVAAFLEALTASGSAAVLTNRRYVGNGGTELPYFLLRSVVIGEPWGYNYNNARQRIKLGSPKDRAFRRTCFRMLARMAFLSAERTLSRAGTHPFMVLLETNRGPMLPFDEFRTHRIVDFPVNQFAVLDVLYLMTFVYRALPWPRRQYLADVEHAISVSTPPADCIGHSLVEMTMRMMMIVPGFFWEFVVNQSLWHVLLAYGAGSVGGSRYHLQHQSQDSLGVSSARAGDIARSLSNVFFSNRQYEANLIRMLKENRLVATWLCGEGRRPLLLDICRQRRRRVVEAVAVGAPSAFSIAVPELLAFVRGPSVRGKKQRLVAWLESRSEG